MNRPAASKRTPPKTPKTAGRTAPEPSDEDLIGGPAPEDPLVMALADVYGGVSSSWLAQVFGHDKNTIAKRLASAGLEVIGRRNGGPLYRIPDAAAYLVKPKVDLISYIKSLRPNDLPPMLNDAYWAAMLKRQKWEENAGDLWRTEDVLTVFGDLAFSFKTTANLWVEEVDRTKGLTPEQRLAITQLTDNLLESVYRLMVEAPNKRQTLPSASEEGARPPESTDPGEAPE